MCAMLRLTARETKMEKDDSSRISCVVTIDRFSCGHDSPGGALGDGRVLRDDSQRT